MRLLKCLAYVGTLSVTNCLLVQGQSLFRTPVTKRKILRHTSSVFDPLGLVTPVTVTAKLLPQELWSDSAPWDTVLNDTYQSKWASITADIPIASRQWFPRQYIPSMLSASPSIATLHVFADASPMAYGAVAYI